MSWVGSPTAVRIRTMVTSPALGILAAPTLANVAVILQGKQGSPVTKPSVSNTQRFFGVSLAICPHHCSHAVEVSPDCNNLAPIKRNAIHLSNEDGCHGLVQCSPIHVDGGTHWEHETRHSLVDAQVLLQASKRDRQSTGTEERKFIIDSLLNDNPTPNSRTFVTFYKNTNKT